MPARPARDVIRFAEKTLLLLDQGGFTATYKFAVLLGLLDLCLEASARDGSPPTMVTTRQFALKVVELYWPQTAAFPGRGAVLQQNRSGQAEIVTLIQDFRRSRGVDPSASLHRARLASPDGFRRLVEDVEWKLIEMPLPRLQRVGRSVDAFIYEIGWSETVRRRAVRSGDFDNRILLRPGAADSLVELSGLLRPLVHRRWVDCVTQFNRLPESNLEDFLFGVDRISLLPVRGPLLELQEGRCFYCGERLRTEGAHVDHFVPWARHPDGGIHNLVAAHAGCNGDKSDFLAAAEHVSRWSERLSRQAADLATLALAVRWEHDAEKSVSVARAVYAHLPDDARLWARGREFVLLERERIRDALRDAA